MVNSGGSGNEWSRFMLEDKIGDQIIMIGHTESEDYANGTYSVDP
jgi:hypothetical protein